jgi:formylglycine-generating enzyme required for sulfatase activity
MHHVHGNVWEWCADWFGPYSLPTRAGDGLRLVPEAAASLRVPRGGSFTSSARSARSSYRRDYTPTLRYISLGLRAARPVRAP